ncbi:MAG: hypothetical protein JWN68_3798 [Nocardioides sp.]|jgi:hypothetical protein|uniref:hypothetical protein n=1 Tax=Nocardioides sp. TaxID=35761 RepID=UPI002601E06F|nr:hypothetical protein [Nocardioides sp.]MCW2835845.1 hypothetical protein [Nocardioides sp.]
MTEFKEQTRPEAGESEVEVSAVAEVLASMQGLETRPVADHVAVFEHAHEQLRRALDPRHG